MMVIKEDQHHWFTSFLIKKTDLVKEAKLTELENKIPGISNLASKTALTAAENNISNISTLVKKQTITLKLQKLKINLLIIIMTNTLNTQEFSKLTADVFNARIAQANLIAKTDFDVNFQILTEQLLQIKQNTYLLKMS